MTQPPAPPLPETQAPDLPAPALADAPPSAVDQAVAQGGAYEVLRQRLLTLGARVEAVATDLNTRRLAEFGDSTLALLGRFRIMTEHSSLGRDVVEVPDGRGGSLLLFGFNVFTGLKTQTRVSDVFGLYHLSDLNGQYDVEPVSPAGTFLADATFQRDFEELYAYYKDARLLQLAVRDGRLLAAFQIGARSSDMRVFRWAIRPDGTLSYLDARGNADLKLPAPFDFAWTRAGRELEVSGRHPHLNILDTLFVETSGGDLTVKVENNTETGEGIYSEPVEDRTQSLDDAQFEFAQVGSLILLKVLPYRETAWRGLVYNTVTRRVTRLDAITQACVQLPEDHGIIFPGGYYLQNGEHKAFDAVMQGMHFERALRSPNGEDVLFSFYEPEEGRSALFVYNLIARQVQAPLFAHGYALMPDGRMVLFTAESAEATRVHQMQVWQTPFTTDEFAASRPPSTTALGRLGNAELVRGISNLFNLAREIGHPDVSAPRYQLLTHSTRRLFDLHHWFTGEVAGELPQVLHDITATAESVLDEFEKVQAIRAQAQKALEDARAEQRRLLGSLQPEGWTRIQEYVDALAGLTAQRGRLMTIRDLRYIDTAAIDAMAAEVQGAHARLGVATGTFLAGEQALTPFTEALRTLEAQSDAAQTTRDLAAVLDAMTDAAGDLDMLSELMTGLKVEDATERTRVVEAISGIYARLNQARARTEQKRRTLGEGEAVAQFAAQFSLYAQSITGALGLSTTPEKADEQLARLMVQLEELEGQFGEHERFLGDILAKREEVLEVFETHKQALLDERGRRAQAVQDAAGRILAGLGKRTERLGTPDDLNAFFAGDPLVVKLRDLTARLRDLGDAVKADDVEARLKAARDNAVRTLRDRSDLFEDGGHVIRLGPRHRFSVNTQPLDLTLLPRGNELAVHLTGTDFMQPLNHPVMNELRDYWPVTLPSESPDVSRAEYLAGQVLWAAQEGREGLDLAGLSRLGSAELEAAVRAFAAPRYREGYEKGVHDHDAARILERLLPLLHGAGTLAFPPDARAWAALVWAHLGAEERASWQARLTSAHAMQRLFGGRAARVEAVTALGTRIAAFLADAGLPHTPEQTAQAAEFLAEELRQTPVRLGFTQAAADLNAALDAKLAEAGLTGEVQASLDRLDGDLAGRWALLTHWLGALATTPEFAALARHVPEAAALRLYGPQVQADVRGVALTVPVDGLLSEHPRIAQGALTLSVDDTLARLTRHRDAFMPAFERYQAARQEVIAAQRDAMRLTEFQARPLTTFVRNRLINDVYLPIIGDNLAKQMGTAGEGKRSDLMGLLMLISPPGYGKTTLMEYVAHQLGLVFMKINGPSLGHEVRSLDPAQAPDATSRQELEKLNLALEMGNNVMLYVDDIQHTHPEFLQKFISLTDATRRIEGVWQGRTKTYDLRGKKFVVVMAGNPYTESGDVFRIPDMLANRADVYNLGDVLNGREDAFLLSYIENSLTSNPVLAPLATRDLADLYLLAERAQGRDVSLGGLKHTYSDAEISEIVATLRRLMQVRDVLFRINAQYIASAAQADAYRQEPPFKLQGSYRNMNKLAEKVSPVLNDAELQALIADHYLREAQLLTTGAEENLLKLGELRGTLTPDEAARWAQIKADYRRAKKMGGDDTGQRMVAQLADIASGLQALGTPPGPASTPDPDALKATLEPLLAGLTRAQEQTGQLAAALPGALQASLQGPLTELARTVQRSGPAENLPAALHATLAPLIESLTASSERQAQTTDAIRELMDTIRRRQTPASGFVRLPATAEGRHTADPRPDQP